MSQPEETNTENLVPTRLEASLALMYVATGLDSTKGEEIIENYKSFVKESMELSSEAFSINISDRNDKIGIAQAKQLLAFFKDKNKGLDVYRVQIKEPYKKATDFIDGAAREIRRTFFEPHIEHLQRQANFVKDLEAKEAAERLEKRNLRIAEITDVIYTVEPEMFNDEQFEAFLDKLKADKQTAIDLENLRIENERLAKEAEANALLAFKAENERLRLEAEKTREQLADSIEKLTSSIEAERIATNKIAEIASELETVKQSIPVPTITSEVEPLNDSMKVSHSDAEAIHNYLNNLESVPVPNLDDIGFSVFCSNLSDLIKTYRETIKSDNWSDPDCPF